MAEAVAAIGLVASIASLIDVCSKLVSRLHQFTSATSDVPETFRSLASQLPLLTKTLERFQANGQKNVSSDVAKALTKIVDETSVQLSLVQTRLYDVLPKDSDRTHEKLVKALKSLTKEDRISHAVDKIHKNVDILTLYQTTENAAATDLILQEISALRIASTPGSAVSANPSQAQNPASYSFGLCLGQAPQIDVDAFLGRKSELAQLREWLPPVRHARRQCIVAIVGMGGVGKTQLSLAHANDCADDYSSIFWINADSKDSLQQGLIDIDGVVFPEDLSTRTSSSDDQLRINRVRRWLSEAGNDKWLLIFDNYDDPHLPGLRSTTGYDIRSFFPVRVQGTILITSRVPKLTFGKQLRLRELTDPALSLAILSSRSALDLSDDAGAKALVERLHGLPLALAAAGTYIGRAGITCDEYLNLYNSAWSDLVGSGDEELLEYETRTMASTWNISLEKVKQQDMDAAKLFLFLAYMGNGNINYELVQAGTNDKEPWLNRVTGSRIQFQRTLSRLQDYSLIEATQEGCRVHPCLYDWLVAKVESPPSLSLFTTALMCVVNKVKQYQVDREMAAPRKLVVHVQRLMCPHFAPLWQQLHNSVLDLETTFDVIGSFVLMRGPRKIAMAIYEQMLATYDKQFGPEHHIPRVVALYLARMYADLCEYNKAKPMFQRILGDGDKVLEKADRGVIAEDLGRLYYNQGSFEVSKRFYTLAYDYYRDAFGVEKDETIRTLVELYTLDMRLGNKTDSETETAIIEVQNRCLQSRPTDHDLVSHNYFCLADVYTRQNKLDQAESIYNKVLAGREARWGVGNASEFQSLQRLGSLYQRRGDWTEAARLLVRALDMAEITLGYSHNWTLRIVEQLGDINLRLDQSETASSMYARAITSFSTTFEEQGTLSRADIRHFAAVLMKSIITTDRKSQELRARILHLIRLTKDNFNEENILLDMLARTLASVGSDEDAQAGYELYATTIDLGLWVGGPQLYCDGCDQACNVNDGLYVCRYCPDIDVCDECMSKGFVPDQNISTCLQHSFFRFRRGVSPDAANTSANFSESCKAWLEELGARFSTSHGSNWRTRS